MELIRLVNDLEPYAFSLVDTYGLFHKNRLMHYFEFVNAHMKTTIGLDTILIIIFSWLMRTVSRSWNCRGSGGRWL